MTGLAPKAGPYNVSGMPVAVPADFMGVQYYAYPGVTPTPTNVTAGVSLSCYYGSLNMPDVFWASIELTAGVYTWTTLDAWVAAHHALGHELFFSTLYCPSFYSANPATVSQVPGWPGIGGPLDPTADTVTLVNGINYKTVGLNKYAAFITALLQRYISQGTPFKFLQGWEEPDFPSTVGVGNWWGTVNQLVDVAYTVYTAAKAVDATIVVMSPSVPVSQFSQYVTAAGTVHTTKYGYDTCDVWASDLFNIGAPAFGHGVAAWAGGAAYALTEDFPRHHINWSSQTTGHSKPFANTSSGYDYVAANAMAQQNAFMAASPAMRKTWLARTLLIQAALGYRLVCLWSYDGGPRLGQYWCGDLVNDTNGVVAAVNEIAAHVVGKTMTSCSYYEGGVISATFSDSTTYTI